MVFPIACFLDAFGRYFSTLTMSPPITPHALIVCAIRVYFATEAIGLALVKVSFFDTAGSVFIMSMPASSAETMLPAVWRVDLPVVVVGATPLMFHHLEFMHTVKVVRALITKSKTVFSFITGLISLLAILVSSKQALPQQLNVQSLLFHHMVNIQSW